jgi:hypothetical protein
MLSQPSTSPLLGAGTAGIKFRREGGCWGFLGGEGGTEWVPIVPCTIYAKHFQLWTSILMNPVLKILHVLNSIHIELSVLPLQSYNSPNLSLLNKGHPTSHTSYLYLHTGWYLLPLAYTNPGVEMGGWFDGYSPVLFPLCGDIGRGTDSSLLFRIWLYSLSPPFRREARGSLVGWAFTWCLSLLMWRWGRVTRDIPYWWQKDSYLMNVPVSFLQNNLSFFSTPTNRCPCRLVNFSCPYSWQ